ncbi:hypothetical protein [Roseomonas gilardii]|uniref:hypothetical protein n=1 Tax=Roseomonas gilardii TaxID=257708 RepID=UPI0011C07C19|nr:hypothetical protein [Roseomonas gilardii]
MGLEAWLAYDLLVSSETEDELVPPISADPERDGRWLAAQKAARHLGVEPPSHDPVEVERFVERYQNQYVQRRHGGNVGT